MFILAISIFGITSNAINSLIQQYGYLALVVLMALEGASLPLPSEVIIPAAGYLSATGVLNNAYIAYIAVLLGNTVGMAIDYAIGYYFGKEVVYRHLRLFHVKQSSLDAFDAWFERNGSFAVFVSRLLPEVRGLMSLPAGFARMPLKKFFFWSILGSAIWDVVLFAFGYYLIGTNNIILIIWAAGLLAVVLYLVYRFAIVRIRKPRHEA